MKSEIMKAGKELENSAVIKDQMNDTDWACLVVFLVESEVQFLEHVQLFETSAASERTPLLINIKPKNINIPKGDKEDKISYLAIEIKKYILTYKMLYLKEKIDPKPSKMNVSIATESTVKYKNKRNTKKRKTDLSNESLYGPFVYFVLTKFYEPLLPAEMIKIGIPLHAIYELSCIPEVRSSSKISQKTNKSTNVSALQTFWLILINEMSNISNKELFADIIIAPLQCNLENQVNSKERGEFIYKFIIQTLSKLAENINYHIHYLSNLRKEVIESPKLETNFSIYKNQVDSIPLECLTIEYILFSIVEQVECNISDFQKNNDAFENKNEQEKKRQFEIRCKSAKSIQIGTSQEMDAVDSIYKPIYDSTNLIFSRCLPAFIHHRDKVHKKSFHLFFKKYEFNSINYYELSLMPYIKLWNHYPEPTKAEKVFHNNHLNRLMKKTSEIYSCSMEEFLIHFHQMLFNKMCSLAAKMCSNYESNVKSIHFKSSLIEKSESQKITSLSQSTKTEKSQIFTSIDLDQEKKESEETVSVYTKREKDIEMLKKFLECNEVIDILTDIDTSNLELEYHKYVEQLDSHLLVQTLKKCFENFQNLDYIYSNLTDKILFWFHNDADDNRLSRSFSEGVVRTPLGFRDFYFHVLEKERHWLSEDKECITNINCSSSKLFFSKKLSVISPDTFSANSNDTVGNQGSFSNNTNGSFRYVAYEGFGSSIIKASEDIRIFYSIDGPKITVKKSKCHKEDTILSIILNCNKNILTWHQIITNKSEAPNVSSGVYFQLETSTGIIFSCMKEKIPEDKLIRESVGEVTREVNLYDIVVSLPTGLIIEYIRGEVPYIKQYYLPNKFLESPLSEEKYRIFLRSGVILVYMKDNSIIVLHPNSTEMRIKAINKPTNQMDKAKAKINKSNNYINQSINLKGKKSVRVTERDSGMNEYQEVKPAEKKKAKILRYEVVNWNGMFKRYEDDKLIFQKHIYKLRAAVSNAEGLYAIRTDGTKSFIKSDGTQIVQFQDGTRITSTPLDAYIEVHADDSYENLYRNPSGSIINFVLEEDNFAEVPFHLYDLHFSMTHKNYMKTDFDNFGWTIHFPDRMKLIINLETGFNLLLDKYTSFMAMADLLTITSKNLKQPMKQTVTHLFLKDTSENYTVCSALESTGKVFIVTNHGEANILTKDRSMSMCSYDSGCLSYFSANLITESNMLLQKNDKERFSLSGSISNNMFRLFPEELIHQISENEILNQTYFSTKSNTKNNLKINQFNRFFVMNRDLTGYEYIHEQDNKFSLEKFSYTDLKNKTSKSFISQNKNPIVSQKSIFTTWSKFFTNPSEDSIIQTSYLQKKDLSPYLPRNKTWLLDLGPNNEKKGDLRRNSDDYFSETGISKAILVRKVKEYSLTNISITDLFKHGICKYHKENEEILTEFRNHLVEEKRSKRNLQEEDNLLIDVIQYLKRNLICSEDEMQLDFINS